MSLWTGNKTNLKNLEFEKMTNSWNWDFKGIFILYIDDILNIIEANFGLELPEDSLYYSRLVIHLKFFMQRVIKGESDDENFEKLIISAKSDINKKIGITLDSIERYLNEEFDYVLSEAERFYLLVHISRII